MSAPRFICLAARTCRQASLLSRQSRPTIFRIATPYTAIPRSRFLSSSDPKPHTPNSPVVGTVDVNSDTSSVSPIPPVPLPPPHLSEAELRVYEILCEELEPSELEVQDISGGCGSMYGIDIVSEKFRGLGMLKQQRLVNAALKELMDRENWHGVQIKTRAE